MANLVIVRHGQSEWNKENRFTGWIDVDLSPKGAEEAASAGEKLMNYKFEMAFSSALKRANRTLSIILEAIGQSKIPVYKDLALNERMYGDLQGLNKDEVKAKHGEVQFNLWRRSYDVAPPNGESLKDTADRVIPYYQKFIEPELKKGKNIIIAAHGNSLRALVMYIEKLTSDQILKVEIPTGMPKLYSFDNSMNIIDNKYI
jgi:2,3-bisphosphoglycerate-dependent phosphoglycerate mutase